MAGQLELYPPSPTDLPANLTVPSRSYRLRVLVVLVSLFLFAALYFGLVGATGYLTYRMIQDLRHTEARERSLVLLNETWRELSLKEARIKGLADQLDSGALDEASFADQMKQQVTDPWEQVVKRLDRLEGLSRRDLKVVEEFKAGALFLQSGLEDLAAGVRKQDRALFESHLAKATKAEAILKENESEFRRLFSGVQAYDEARSWSNPWIGVFSAPVFLFLVKGLFKWRRQNRASRVELKQAEHPEFFAFIDQLCRETRAPRPHRVYVSPDVNAAVFFNESILNLVFPTRKNLLIGLGLVNGLNLSEFKAVLAHEFGHFSQSSMRLGTYVYTSNRIIGDIVYQRDWMDSLMAGLSRVDIRISIFVWIFMGIVWVLRKVLETLFRVINFANSRLSKQMEFHADLVAASVAGSDVPVHALARLELANNALGEALSELSVAVDHKLYTRDVFYHQTKAADRLREQAAEGEAGASGLALALPVGPDSQVFQDGDTSVPSMWETHPTNRERELNLKRRYVAGVVDERSPWLLFRNPEELRAQLSRQMYASVPRLEKAEVELSDPEVVQRFIDGDRTETTYPAHYHGFYNERYLFIDDMAKLEQEGQAAFSGSRKLAETSETLRGTELKERMEAYLKRRDEIRELNAKGPGEAEAKARVEQLSRELEADLAWMKGLDERGYQAHYLMARELGEAMLEEFRKRYVTHTQLQAWHNGLNAKRARALWMLHAASGRNNLSQSEYGEVRNAVVEARDALLEVVKQAQNLELPALVNVEEGQRLAPLLLDEPPCNPITSKGQLGDETLQKFLMQLENLAGRLGRIMAKSLGGILSFQERVEERWKERHLAAESDARNGSAIELSESPQ